MKPIIFAFPENESLARNIQQNLHCQMGNFIVRRFPDQETYIRILSEVDEKNVIIICALNNPDNKILPLYFLCQRLREMNVKSICLVAPYLSYMRQDKQFLEGEAVTSKYFASLLSTFIDRLITIDPHLHRRNSLGEIFSIPTDVIHSSIIIAEWIKQNLPNALLIGPDIESEQWVSEVARLADVPYQVLRKERNGDRDVAITFDLNRAFINRVPVILDDIISSAGTMIETVSVLKASGMPPPVCIGVHAVFAPKDYQNLLSCDVRSVITCNTIEHESNRIDISGLLSKALQDYEILIG